MKSSLLDPPQTDSQSGSLSKKGSQSSFEFGRGEIRDQGSPLPDRSPNMLKHASSGGGAKKVGTVQTSQETSTSLKLPQVRNTYKYKQLNNDAKNWAHFLTWFLLCSALLSNIWDFERLQICGGLR